MAERFDFQTSFQFIGEGELQNMITLLDQAIIKMRLFQQAQRGAGKAGGAVAQGMAQVSRSGKVVATSMAGAAKKTKIFVGATKAAAKASQESAATITVSWQSIRRVITGVVLARALGKVSAAITKAATDAATLQLKIEELRAIQGDAAVTADKWADALFRVSNATGIDSLQVAEAAYQALSNQVANAANVTNFLTESIISLSRVTASDLNTSVSAVSAILNSYSLSIDHAEEVSAALFATVEQGRLRLTDIANSIGNVTIVSNQLGISFQEVLGSVATLTRQGTSAANAQTFLRNAMLALIKPTEEMQGALANMGFASGDAATKQLGLIRTLELLSRQAKGTNSELAQMAKFFSRIRGLIGATGLVADLEKTAFIIDRVAGSLEDFRDRAKEVSESTFVILQKESTQTANSFQKMFITIRDGIAAINEVKFLDISDTVSALSVAFGVTLVLALGKAAFATKALSFSFAALGGALGVGAIIGAFVGQLISIQIASRRAEFSQFALARRVVQAAKISQVAWAGAANSILSNLRHAAAGAEAAFTGLVNTIKNQLAEINAALEASMSAGQRIISLAVNPRKRIPLILGELQAGLDLTANAGNAKNAEAAAKFLDHTIQLYKQLIADAKELRKLNPSNLFGSESVKFQEALRITSKANLKIIKGQIDLFAVEIQNLTLATKQRVEGAKFGDEILTQAKAVAAANAENVKLTGKNLENAQTEVDVRKSAADQAEGIVATWGALVPEGSFAAFFQKGLEHPPGPIPKADRKGGGGGGFADPTTLGLSTEDLAIRAELERLKSLLKRQTDIQAFTDGIVSVEEAAELKRVGEQIAISVQTLKDAGFQVPQTLVDNVGVLGTLFEQLESLDPDLLKLRLDFFKELADKYDQIANRLGAVVKAVQPAIDGSEELKVNVIIAMSQINESLAEMAVKVENFRQQVAAIVSNLAAGKAAAAATPAPAPRRPGTIAGGFPVGRFATGGSLPGVGEDQRTASFAAGEFISNQASSAKFLPQLIAMNSGAFSQRREGGGNVTSVGDINMTIQGGETAEASVRQIGNEIRRELRRGTLRLN